MDLRIPLLNLAAQHGLARADFNRLLALAGLSAEPPALARRLAAVLGIAGAALLGLGLIFLVAAQWGDLGRPARVALLQAAVLLPLLAAWLGPRAARAPLALLGFLACGGLLAYIGQTYQTGADPWQLFALWALIGLPLACAVRHDVLWAPWSLVALTGISLWMQAHSEHSWTVQSRHLTPHLMGWLMTAAVAGLLSGPLRPITGAGLWSLRTALTLASFIVAITALVGLFSAEVRPQYPLGLLVVLLGLALLASRRGFDVFGLSALALALNGLLVAGLARALFSMQGGPDPFGRILLIALISAGLLAFSVSAILARTRRVQGEAA
ncbi:MAG: DUF2157 domain-containing protein [Rubrivivax sp.]|nr:DUF2157 domain-containing protein [Rubrivivax sp.]